MKSIVEILNSKRNDAWFGKTFLKLKASQLKFVEDYLVHNQNVDFNEFHKNLNRLFVIAKVENVNGNSYEYDIIFPINKKGNHPNVSIAQEIMSAVFNEFKKGE
jgi:hypothetical protein